MKLEQYLILTMNKDYSIFESDVRITQKNPILTSLEMYISSFFPFIFFIWKASSDVRIGLFWVILTNDQTEI